MSTRETGRYYRPSLTVGAGMTYRKIISPALMRQQNATNTTERGDDGTFDMSQYAPHVFTILFTNFRDLMDDSKPSNQIYVFMIIVSVLTLVTMLVRRKPKRKEMEAIALHPLGIQLGTIPVDVNVNNFSSSDIMLTPQEFLRRETIIDCVVTELVFSYKVQSAVILRIKQPHDEFKNVNPMSTFTDNKTDAEDDGITKSLTRTRRSREIIYCLIHLFSDFEMTYLECLNIRSQINNYLNQKDELVTARKSRDVNRDQIMKLVEISHIKSIYK